MKILFKIFLFLFWFHCSAQDYHIELPVNNYIYTDISMPFNIIYCGNYKDLKLSSKNAEINSYKEGKFTIRTENEGRLNIDIYNKKTKTLDSIFLRVKPLPLPKVILSGHQTIKISLQNSKRLFLIIEELPDLHIENYILKYNVTIVKREAIIKFQNLQDPFSNELQKVFAELNTGDFVIIN